MNGAKRASFKELLMDPIYESRLETLEKLHDLNTLPMTPEIPNCYMYTVLHCLANLKNFTKFLIYVNPKQFGMRLLDNKLEINSTEEEASNIGNFGSPCDKQAYAHRWLCETIKYILNLNGSAFNEWYRSQSNLAELIECVQEHCPPEEDAVAFCEHIIDNLDELYRKGDEDNVLRLFKSKWSVSYKCKKCVSIKNGPDDLWSIWRAQIEDIGDDNLIDTFFKHAELKPYKCESCDSEEGEADIVTNLISEMPLCLVIQIQRLVFKNGFLYKMDRYVQFDERAKIKDVTYELRGVIVHLGDGFQDGHYIVVVKKKLKTKPDDFASDNLWFVIDGDKVNLMHDLSNDFVHHNAVALFYNQVIE